MKNIVRNGVGILVLYLMTSCGSRGNRVHQAGDVPLGQPGSGWLARQGTEGTNLWRMGKAEIDPSDREKFVVSDGEEMVNTGEGGVDIYTEEKYSDVHVELEFMIPDKGNSGIYLMGEYEVQIYDSYWLKTNNQEILANQWMCTIVATNEPTLHPEKGGGEWQLVSIDFLAPRFDASGSKISNAMFRKVALNGVLIHENIEVQAPTPVCLTGKESAEGPLMFQGFAGPVAYRNVRIKPLGDHENRGLRSSVPGMPCLPDQDFSRPSPGKNMGEASAVAINDRVLHLDPSLKIKK